MVHDMVDLPALCHASVLVMTMRTGKHGGQLMMPTWVVSDPPDTSKAMGLLGLQDLC